MIVLKAHKIKLNPTDEQARYFWRAAGVNRFAWNWALAEYNKRNGKVKIVGKGSTLKAEFCALKNKEYPWVSEVTTYAYQQAFADLQKAVSRYFKLKKKGELTPPKNWKPRKDGKPFGWPRFKSRNRITPSFYESNIGLKFDGHQVRFPKLGWVDMYESLRFQGKVMGGRITYSNNHWWLSVQVEISIPDPQPKSGSVGVDLGIKYLAVTSGGVIYENPKALIKAEKKLGRLQRKLDRQRRANNPDNYNENGTVKEKRHKWTKSNKMKKTEQAINKLHTRVANIRREVAHELTSEIATSYGIIGVENLNIKGMMSNRRLSKHIADAGMYEKRRQLEYKATWNGGLVVPVSQWFPSSKMCHSCKAINTELTLSIREWTCENCGSLNHRDENAAINIENEALRLVSA